MRVVAIDPGAKGGVACMAEGLILHGVMDMPALDTAKGLYSLIDSIKGWGADRVVLELQRCRGGNAALATWNHARHYGKLEACLTMIDLPIILVEPTVWLRKVRDVVGDPMIATLDATKARTWTLAHQLFPGTTMVGPRGKKKDGQADAICLGWYYLTHTPEGSLNHPGV